MNYVIRSLAALGVISALAGCGGGAAAPSPAPASSSPPAAPSVAASASAAASSAAPAKPASAPAGSAAPVSAAAGQLTKIKSAYTAPSAVNAPLWVGVDEGIFRKNGLDVSLELAKDTAVPAALMGGELDFSVGGGNEVVLSDLGGGSLVMLATASDYPIFSLFADKKYTKVQDLAGQTLGITQAGSATDVAAHLFLDHFHLLDSVKLTPTGTVPAIFAAMGKGLVAGGILSPPTTAKATKAGFVELVNGIKLGEPLTHAGLLVTRAYATDHRDVVKQILKGYAEAWTYCANTANKAQVVKAVAKYTKSEPAAAEAAYDAVLPVWQKKRVPTVDPAGIAGVLKLANQPKAKTAKPEQFIDNSLLQSVAP